MEQALKLNPQIIQGIKFDICNIPEIKNIETQINTSLSDSQGVIREMCNHLLSAGGKMIRPLLVLYSGLVFSDMKNEFIQAASAAEIIHMASLVHDDIIDASSLRRNKPSINKAWGNTYAVLCGDYLFAKAFGILSGNMLMRSMDYMVEAIQNMCDGEIRQAEERFNTDIDLNAYYDRILKKTAILFECCCKSGAACAGAQNEQINALGAYGLNLGLAFQIIDDIMDFCGNPAHMGKPKGKDLSEGNITLPIILLLKEPMSCKAIKIILSSHAISQKDIEFICAHLNTSGVIDRCFDYAKMHIEKAKESLIHLPESAYTGLLNDLANQLYLRIN